jgi:hypothetical protein
MFADVMNNSGLTASHNEHLSVDRPERYDHTYFPPDANEKNSGQHIRAALALVQVLVVSITVQAQGADASTYTTDQLHQHFQNVAQTYVMRSGNTRLKLREQPLMHWQNTVRQQEQGALYMWAKNGRPQVLGSIFTFQNAGKVQCRHELISLADGPISAQLDATSVWSPERAGVKWIACDSVAAPTQSAPRRLTQMRAIARQFSGRLEITDRQTANLSLIPQPLVRYQAPEAGVIDGAVFSMAVVTDPEIFLLVEAKKSGGGPAAWYYAAARSHFQKLELRRERQIVWQAPAVAELANTRAGQFPFTNQPYFVFFPPKPLPAPEELR